MIQGKFDIPDHVRGTTFHPWTFEITVNGSIPETNLTEVAWVFSKDGEQTLEVPVTITSAENWTFTSEEIDAVSMRIEEGIHSHDIKTTDSSGNVEKFIRGEMKILPSSQQ